MMNLKDIPGIIKRFITNKSESDDEIVAAIVMIVAGLSLLLVLIMLM